MCIFLIVFSVLNTDRTRLRVSGVGHVGAFAPPILTHACIICDFFVLGDSKANVYVTEIWYSSLLSKETYYYLCTSLGELLLLNSATDLTSATNELIRMNGDHFQDIHYVWRQWLYLEVVGTSSIRERRQQVIKANPGSSFGLESYYKAIPKEHVPSARKYVEHGVFQCTEECSFAENPTLTGHPVSPDDDGPFTYCVVSEGMPFAGWDYIKVKKFKYNESLVSMYASYIGSELNAFMKKLASGQVSFDIVLGDCMKIEEDLNEEEKYDRIVTSNLMDYILLPELLRYVKSRSHAWPWKLEAFSHIRLALRHVMITLDVCTCF